MEPSARAVGQCHHDVAGASGDWMVTQKKTVGASERAEVAREAFRHLISTLNVEAIVVVDESGTHMGMIRLHGRVLRGQRAYAQTLRNYGKNVSLIASLTVSGMGAAMTIEGAVDPLVFVAYVRHVLAPRLRPGQIVILDNLSIHKSAEVRRLIEARGCTLLFCLPTRPI